MAILRDGKKLIGVMRSYDQFGEGPCARLFPWQVRPALTPSSNTTSCLGVANLVFQDAVERIYVGDKFTDIPVGMYLIRGENVVMLGEVVSLPSEEGEFDVR